MLEFSSTVLLAPSPYLTIILITRSKDYIITVNRLYNCSGTG